MQDLATIALAIYAIYMLQSGDYDGPFSSLAKIRYTLGVRYDEHSYKYGKTKIAVWLLCEGCSPLWYAVFAYGLYILFPDPVVWVAKPIAIYGVVLWLVHLSRPN